MAEPFVRWVGGKRGLLQALRVRVPTHKRYFEPFVGGGALFFSLAENPGLQQAFLSDANEDLVNAYLMIRDCVEEVLGFLAVFRVRAEKVGQELFYYELRDRYPRQSTPFGAARFIYLLAACYNGLYRVNRRGDFNVSFGRDDGGGPKSVSIDDNNLVACAESLQIADVRAMDFRFMVEVVTEGDFVYADPPYATHDKDHYTGYTAERYGWSDQEELASMSHTFVKRGATVLISQPFDEGILSLYQSFSSPSFKFDVVSASRSVSASGKTRGRFRELLITGSY